MTDPNPMDDSPQREAVRALLVALVFALVAAFAVVDLIADLGDGITLRHALIEGGIILCGVFGLAAFARRYGVLRRRERAARDEVTRLGMRLEATQLQAERWRVEARDALAGLGIAIDRQLVRWGLTPAEKEIALLLLKGLSHKQVAVARAVSEATVRQQARGIYKKAGVDGRHDLAAFFLEALLLPATSTGG